MFFSPFNLEYFTPERFVLQRQKSAIIHVKTSIHSVYALDFIFLVFSFLNCCCSPWPENEVDLILPREWKGMNRVRFMTNLVYCLPIKQPNVEHHETPFWWDKIHLIQLNLITITILLLQVITMATVIHRTLDIMQNSSNIEFEFKILGTSRYFWVL